ncbi:MAG: preprotein translocase subunit Sec61beta [Thaumarchaeota archaeon]|nr:preprotein translocase subunit Sec61beta [Nitrososphaerota archaeon]
MSSRKKQKMEALPASSAGLLRFFEDETHGVKIRPEFVIALGGAIAIISILLRIFF